MLACSLTIPRQTEHLAEHRTAPRRTGTRTRTGAQRRWVRKDRTLPDPRRRVHWEQRQMARRSAQFSRRQSFDWQLRRAASRQGGAVVQSPHLRSGIYPPRAAGTRRGDEPCLACLGRRAATRTGRGPWTTYASCTNLGIHPSLAMLALDWVRFVARRTKRSSLRLHPGGGGEPDGTKCSGAAKCSAARRRAVQQIPQRINGTGRDVSEVWVRRWTLQSLDESVGRRAD